MDNFVAIDVETANRYPTSVCAIGAVKVRDGVIVDKFYRLVRPEPNFYYRHFTENIHGINREMTDSAPLFATLWPMLNLFIEGLPLVAHNKAFDERCLRECCRYYGIMWPDFPFYCTLTGARTTIPRQLCGGSYSLPYVADFLGIPFDNHHNALADAGACAKIAMTIL